MTLLPTLHKVLGYSRFSKLILGVLLLTVVRPVFAQTLEGPFKPFNSWWLNPSTGLPGVLGGNEICIDLDADGVYESCYPRPNVPTGVLTNLQVSPSRRILIAYGSTSNCGGSSMVYFFNVPDRPDDLSVIDSECIPNNVNAGQIGFYDTGLCCDGLTDVTCPSLGLDCSDGMGGSRLGVSPQRIAYVADTGDPNSQDIQIVWFDLTAGTHRHTFPGFNSSLQLTRVPVSPYGDVAFVQHDIGGTPDSDYTAVDLCGGDRLGQPLSSNVGGALFNVALPIATAEMLDVGAGNYVVHVTHPDFPGGSVDLDFTPCGTSPPDITGACCQLSSCSLETASDCEVLLGNWLGPDTSCNDCPTALLTVNIGGSGSVSSSPAGISCPNDCTQNYALLEEVTLTATANDDSLFIGWSGDCAGTDPLTIATMNADRKCTATFRTVADLAITKTDNLDPVIAGLPLAYTVTASNAGPADATGVTITDSLPVGVSYNPGASDAACDLVGNSLICNVGNLPNGQQRVIAIGVDVNPETRGVMNNSATVSGDQFDNNSVNNLAFQATTVEAEADLSVTKSATPNPVAAGARLLYQIVVTNAGPSTATGVDITDTLPVGVSPAGNSGSPSQLLCGISNGKVAVGETATLSFSAIVDAGLSDATILTNVVEVAANETDPNPSDNSAMFDSTVSGQVSAPAAPTFVKIADTNTPIPSGNGNFTDFGGAWSPVLSHGYVAFRGRGAGQDGTYLWDGNSISVVADTNTPIPGGTGFFGAPATGGFGEPSIDGQDVAFGGSDDSISQRGVYTTTGGNLNRVADKNTRPLGASDDFSTLGSPSIYNGNISFWAFVPALPIFEGLYYGNAGGITKIADETTFIPGGGGQFSGFNPKTEHRGGKVLFFGRDSVFNIGMYQWIGGVLSVVVDRFTPKPGGVGTFNLFWEQVSHDGSSIAFRNDNASLTDPGIFINDCSGLRVVADSNTPVPCGQGTFAGFGNIASHGGDTAFIGLSPGHTGLYADLGGIIVKVIEVVETLDGKTISNLRIGTTALEGDQVTFKAFFTDGTIGLYLATLTTSGVCFPNDIDEDRDRDLLDYQAYLECVTADGSPILPGCGIFDNDGDNDVDRDDYPAFFDSLTGVLPPATPEACCHGSGSCSMDTPLVCEYVEKGTPMPGETCDANPCIPTQGACCSFKGCLEIDQKLCVSLEGLFFPGMTCRDVQCN